MPSQVCKWVSVKHLSLQALQQAPSLGEFFPAPDIQNFSRMNMTAAHESRGTAEANLDYHMCDQFIKFMTSIKHKKSLCWKLEFSQAKWTREAKGEGAQAQPMLSHGNLGSWCARPSTVLQQCQPKKQFLTGINYFAGRFLYARKCFMPCKWFIISWQWCLYSWIRLGI